MIFKTKKLERSLVFLNETRDGIVFVLQDKSS